MRPSKGMNNVRWHDRSRVRREWTPRGSDQIRYSIRHNDDRIHHIDLFPDPVIVSVNVDAENSDISGETAVADQTVDVVAVNPCSDCGQVVSPVDVAAAHPFHVFSAAIDDQPAPVVTLEKKSRVGLQVVLDAKFDECLLTTIDTGLTDQILQDSVFTILRENLELSLVQVIERCAVGILQGEGSALEDHQVFNLAQRRRELPPGHTGDLLNDWLGNQASEGGKREFHGVVWFQVVRAQRRGAISPEAAG